MGFAREIDDPGVLAKTLKEAPRPLTIMFSNHQNAGLPNEDGLATCQRQINRLRHELLRLRRCGEFKTESFVADRHGTHSNGTTIQRFVKTHSEFERTQNFTQKVEHALEKTRLESREAQNTFMQKFSLIRRHNPLSSKRRDVQAAQTSLIRRWEGVMKQLGVILASAKQLERKRSPQPCERATTIKANSTLRSNPCWVHGGADVAGVPQIGEFFSSSKP